MKKLLLILLAAGFAQAATFYNRTENRDVEVVTTKSFSLMVFDVLLLPGDTVHSRPFDLLRVPVNYRDTGTGDAVVLPDLTMGSAILSCYDQRDSAGVTDSADVIAQFYVSQYAGDNANPYKTGESGGKSDVWAAGNSISFDNASDAQAVSEGTTNITLASQLDRFARWRIINRNTGATGKDQTRCRLFWVKKEVAR